MGMNRRRDVEVGSGRRKMWVWWDVVEVVGE
jgi:hypothetical protein